MDLSLRFAAGDLTQDDLRLLACFGDDRAGSALGWRGVPMTPETFSDWARKVGEWGKPAVGHALTGALRVPGKPSPREPRSRSAVAKVLACLEAWLETEGRAELKALGAACAQVPEVGGEGWPAATLALARACAEPLQAKQPGAALWGAFKAAAEAAGGESDRRVAIKGAWREAGTQALRSWALRPRLVPPALAAWRRRGTSRSLVALLTVRRKLDAHYDGTLRAAAELGSKEACQVLGSDAAEQIRAESPWCRPPWPADADCVRALVEQLRGPAALAAAVAALRWAAAALGVAEPLPPGEARAATAAWLSGLQVAPELQPVQQAAVSCAHAVEAPQPSDASCDFGEHRRAADAALAALEACGGNATDLLRAIQRAALESWLDVTFPDGW